jgi:sirohydrochlorin ferrochelatase
VPAPDVTLLVAHGSRNPRTAADHAALCNAVADALGASVGPARVLPAFLEISEPSIGDAIDDAVAEGARSITVLPLFVHVGNHVEHDIPAIVERARARHPDVHLVLRPHIGAGADFVELVAHAVAR